jgi:phenylalanyl-tRNA synthetase beta chain
MKISHLWLQEYIDLEESPEEIAAILTATGLEVEGIEEHQAVKGGLKGLVIGEVIECAKHPNADKLSLTKVDIGSGELLSIVCGAPNVAAGQKVVVATVGATLYPSEGEPILIKKGKIRGELSEGMICAEDEIGLGSSHAGIMVLNTELPNGTPAAQYFGLPTDYIYEIGLTPNRADAASHFGVARDLKAALKRELRKPHWTELPKADKENKVEVIVRDQACIRYSGVSIAGVKVGPSPDFFQKRLRSIGLEPINNVVDITNYILHGLGQPLHAFDQGKITSGKVEVKKLKDQTVFVSLDGKERKLSEHDLMICNGDEPICIAGVFGGLDSGVSEHTTNVFLESACFSPVSIRLSSKYHGLKTDASFRFERGTDPEMTLHALHFAASLICKWAGGKISSQVVDIYPEPAPKAEISLSYRNIRRLIGIEIPKPEIHRILEDLDFHLFDHTLEGFKVLAPQYRVDVTREADVIEEILRIFGLDEVALNEHNSTDYLAEFPSVDADGLQQKVSLLLSGQGYHEIMTNSLCKPGFAESIQGFDPAESVEILNKLSEDLGVLRQHLAFTGLEVVAYNINHRQKNLKLYEFGKTYKKTASGYKEEEMLILYMSGEAQEESWQEKSRKAEFHDLYKATSTVLEALHIEVSKTTPFKSGLYSYGLDLETKRGVVAKLGMVNPKAAKLAGLKASVLMAEINWQYILGIYKENRSIKPVSKFPEVRRDLSLVLDKDVAFSRIKDLLGGKAFPQIKQVNVFDVYEGTNLEEGKKAYALSFILQEEDRTLTDKDIDKTMNRLMTVFEKELGAIIRK